MLTDNLSKKLHLNLIFGQFLGEILNEGHTLLSPVTDDQQTSQYWQCQQAMFIVFAMRRIFLSLRVQDTEIVS